MANGTCSSDPGQLLPRMRTFHSPSLLFLCVAVCIAYRVVDPITSGAELRCGHILARADFDLLFHLVLPVYRNLTSVPRYDRWTLVRGKLSLSLQHRESELILAKWWSFVVAHERRSCKSSPSALGPSFRCAVADELPLFSSPIPSRVYLPSLLPRASWFFQFTIP